ncbi:MAG TPA: alpha/beta hydrolase, partial [Solirubrobacteraceae bacterium]|nr:alpha/beta hydrolase [Solirubrobacteraceae bacterium]
MSLREHHAYGRARSQVGELFVPGGGGPRPVAVVFHGGFWRAQYGRRLTRAICEDLAGRGWAAWNVEYRRLGRLSGGGWPRTLEDAAAAVDHLADIPRVELDLDRVVAIGHSAGGQLAAWVAARLTRRVGVS